MHWADFTAERLRDERGEQQVACSGITPSGEFHIGHLREILSAEMIHRACLDAGLDSRYIFIVDSMDPLRRVYSFLSPEYERYIGCPLAFIPAPDSNGNPDPEAGSYADHFLTPFLEALGQIGVFPEVIMNHETYSNGEFAAKIHSTIEQADAIREIIESISGRELDENWFPYKPLGSDGSMDGVTVTGYENPFVHWTDRHGKSGSADIRKADGKLPWRIDWAARWGIHGVTCEPAGKDHGAAGGSFDTGLPICRLLGSEPPSKMVYEWIQVKGAGPMSSSSGNTIGPVEALSLVPPEIVRYLIAGSKMNRHIDFDTGSALFQMADEYERLVANPPDSKEEGLSKRQKVAAVTNRGAMKFSQLERGADPADSLGGVSFRHLSMLAQIKSSDEDVWTSMRASGHLTGEPNESLSQRLTRMRNWIGSIHFPEDARIHIHKSISAEARAEISEEQRIFLSSLAEELAESDWSEQAIGTTIREVAPACGIGGREAYIALYWALLGRNHGPKASALLFEIGRESVIALLSS
jgi:lysyl-tRNA synthetase class 1